jgi:hypothetical protein
MNDTAKRVDDAIAAGDTKSVIEQLAALSAIEYGRRRKEEAKKIGVTVGTLDREVNNLRTKQGAEDNFLPHWRIEPWPEKVDGAVLLADLRQQFTRYVVLPKHAAPALALWVLHTWVFGCFDITPYLSITSPTKRCGKTVLMTLLYWLSCRGKKSDSMSKAAIYRSAGEEKPTLVLDEVGWVVDLQDERQGILCGGFEVNGYVEVCEGEGTDITTRRFSTYCPKVFGLIGKLTPTLVDRSICIPLDRKLRTDKVERLRRRDNDEFTQLRRRCLRWANDNAKALAQSPPLELEGLNDRALDFWEPLLTIADRAGGKCPKVARETALALSGESKEDDEDVRVGLLKDIREAFGDADLVRSDNLVAKLTADPERPWADWKRGRPLTQKQLGGLLKPFGIISVNVRLPGFGQGKGYRRADFEEAWAAYCPGQNTHSARIQTFEASIRPRADEMGTSSNFRPVPDAPWDGSKNSNLSNNHAGWDGGTDQKPLDGGEQGFDQASKGGGTSPVCAVCKEPEPPPNQVAIDGLDIWLHPGCEAEHLASLADVNSTQPTLAKPAARTNGAQHQAATHTVAEVPHQIEARPPVDHYAPGGLMDHVNGVIEEQLRGLDEAWKAKREAAVEKVPPAAEVIGAPDPAPTYRPPMLEGDRRREAIRARNQEAVQRFEFAIKERLH